MFLVDLSEVQTAYYMVAATGVLVAAAYYVLNMRATQRNMKETLDTRQSQLFMQIYSRFYESDFSDKWSEMMNANFKDYDEFWAQYGQGTKGWATFWSMVTYFHGIGVLMKRGLVDPSLISELMPGITIQYFEKFIPIYREIRIRRSWPSFGYLAEYLNDSVKGSIAREQPEWNVK